MKDTIKGWLTRDCAELKKGDFVKIIKHFTAPDPYGMGTYEDRLLLVGRDGKFFTTDLECVAVDFENI